MQPLKIGIVIGTLREGRFGERPAQWIRDLAAAREDLQPEIVDLRDYPLPLYGQKLGPAVPPLEDAARRWSAKLAELDGVVFITAEYNRSISGVLKNALDYVHDQLRRKPAAFVGYGGVGGARAVEQLRLMCIELQMAPTRAGVHIPLDVMRAVAEGIRGLSDFDHLLRQAETLLDELAWWGRVLRAGRQGRPADFRDFDRSAA